MRSIIFRVLLVACFAFVVTRADDITIMNALRDQWGTSMGWPATSFVCPTSWSGVNCSEGGRVSSLYGSPSTLLAFLLLYSELRIIF